MESDATILSIFRFPVNYVLCTWITGLRFIPTEDFAGHQWCKPIEKSKPEQKIQSR